MVERTEQDEKYIVQGLEGDINRAARDFNTCMGINNLKTARERLSDMNNTYRDMIFYSEIGIYHPDNLKIVKKIIEEKESKLMVEAQ